MRAVMDRKADTRHKVQLGGIVVKAGAGSVDAFALLGLLVEQTDRFSDPTEVARLRQLGREFHERTARVKLEATHDDLAV
jgi:Conjugal transfer protein TraD